MVCEICGRDFKGKGFKVIVEGAELTVCPNCRKFGTPPSVRQRVPHGSGAPSPAVRPSQGPRQPAGGGPQARIRSMELVEDYNDVVRLAREERGWSQSELGQKIQEKESLVHRIETKSMRPSAKVAKKLEKTLEVTLFERVGDVDVEQKVSLNQGLTIGDIIKFKK
ncbi:MAG: TIGR00270 family protein [Candidatus Methanofastidiosa archaeon]|nr:TIGR00270 family protein [Candidatus Methanofastidiosa archaeon]